MTINCLDNEYISKTYVKYRDTTYVFAITFTVVILITLSGFP